MKKILIHLKNLTVLILGIIIWNSSLLAMDIEPRNSLTQKTRQKRSLPDSEREEQEPFAKKRRFIPLTYGMDLFSHLFAPIQSGIRMILPMHTSFRRVENITLDAPGVAINHQANLLQNLPDDTLFIIMNSKLSNAQSLGSTNRYFYSLFCSPRLCFNLCLTISTEDNYKWGEILKTRQSRRQWMIPQSLFTYKESYVLPFPAQELKLYSLNIGYSGVKSLSNANFPFLTKLNLAYNNIGDSGAKSLSKANFPLLTNLNLAYNNIEDSGAKNLSNANFPLLMILNLSGNHISSEAEDLLKAKFSRLSAFYLM